MNESETPLTQALLDQFGTNGNTDFECYDKLIDHSRTLELRNRKLVEVLNALTQKLEDIGNHPQFIGVFQMAAIHRYKYDGPKWDQEFDNARAVLAEQKEEKP